MKNRGKTRYSMKPAGAGTEKQFRKHEAFMARTGMTLEETHVYFRALKRKHKKAKTKAIVKQTGVQHQNSQQRRELRRKAERNVIAAIYRCMATEPPPPKPLSPKKQRQLMARLLKEAHSNGYS